jgi:hypothetical protein
MNRVFLPNKGSHSRVLSSKGSISGGGGFGDILLGSPTSIDDAPPIVRGTGLGKLPEKIGELKVKSGRKHKNINFNL